VFETAVTKLSQDLARLIAKDGEGLTRLITVQVRGAAQHVEVVHRAVGAPKDHLVNLVQGVGVRVVDRPDEVTASQAKLPTDAAAAQRDHRQPRGHVLHHDAEIPAVLEALRLRGRGAGHRRADACQRDAEGKNP
jgi:hypothetical protein